MITRPTNIDLFAGAGGFAEGLRQAGFVSVFANEKDPFAGRTFSYNHPDIPLVVKPIQDLDSREILDIIKMQVGEVYLISGGPPCQGFSMAGRRIVDDPRNYLFIEFFRIVKDLLPEMILFENVPGLLSMSKGKFLEDILDMFSSIGYKCQYSVMNSADYGVPQTRERFILIGVRSGNLPGFPSPTHRNSRKDPNLLDKDLPPYVNVWDAISDLPYILNGEGEEVVDFFPESQSLYQKDRASVRTPGKLLNHRVINSNETVIARWASIPEGGTSKDIPEHLKTKKRELYKLSRNIPSRTITRGFRPDLIHPIVPRGLTVREAARIQSFNDDYRFFGMISQNAKNLTQDDQVGNSVPPLLAKAIGEHIIRQRKLQ